MKRFAFALAALCLFQGCATTPVTISRHPSTGIEAKAGVGQSIYRYEKKGEKVVDYLNGQTYVKSNDVTYEILYSGISGGELRATYREYVNDMARPAFSQEASYDYETGQSTTISFKGAQIEVLSADNNEIRYRVLRGFDGEENAAPAE